MRSASRSSDSGGRRRLAAPAVDAIDRHLREREGRRDALHERARRLRRLAQGTMGRIHEHERVAKDLATIRREAAALSDWLRAEGRGEEGLARDALQESAEALLLGAIVEDRPLPGPRALRIDPEPYLLGLGDVVGEVRRLALDRLGDGDLRGAEAELRLMEHLLKVLLAFDTTRAIVALKPKQDMARALVERTRGELTMAKMLHGRGPTGGSAL